MLAIIKKQMRLYCIRRTLERLYRHQTGLKLMIFEIRRSDMLEDARERAISWVRKEFNYACINIEELKSEQYSLGF
jgi:hypothetical protein